MPIVSAVRRSANQRLSSTPQEGIFFVQPSLSNTSLMSTPMTSLGAWLTLVGLLVTRTLHFSSITRNSYMISRYIMYGPLANGATITVFTFTPVYPIPLLADSRCAHRHLSPATPWPKTRTSAACATLAAWASPSA